MVVIFWVLGLSLLVQGGLSSMEPAGCRTWRQEGDLVCCEACHSGNRLVRECGPNPKALCTPCENETFTTGSKNKECDMCRQCLVCGCKKGYTCGNARCTFCVTTCGKGQEPTEERSCRPCPKGTFNNQTHKKCKPWSKKCPKPDDQILAEGNAFSDIKCTNASVITAITVYPVTKPDTSEDPWPMMLPVFIGVFLICFIVLLAWKTYKRRPKEEKEEREFSEKMIIGSPSDEPRTLIAIECSFHEAQQEQGSSSESLVSKDSSELIFP
ncbi:tumor necrosis factor receptor superfamily member 9a isoform X2 [Cheilinus undulatus]|uniref:tumor necrosis factor receptor superfamily member 9a isoform X2 n=1 Tax=Cheilinus undulatus TaxID=241271 RepID=UPI001BD30671|nr:tumor necrosis factor receptor superfamily member 9a isoform X2 [Cheilinus undulatus]